MTRSVLKLIKKHANVWRPIAIGALLFAYVAWIVESRSDTPEPYSTDRRLTAALLTPNDVGDDWYRKNVRGTAEGESTACAEFSLFRDAELAEAARVELGQSFDEDDPRWLKQTILVATSEDVADYKFRVAQAVARCSHSESAGRAGFRIEPATFPPNGDGQFAVRYIEIEPEEPWDRPYVAHEVIVRSGRVIMVLFHGRFDRAPELTETTAIVTTMLKRIERYERQLAATWAETPTSTGSPDAASRPGIAPLLPGPSDLEPELVFRDGAVYGTEGSSQDQLFPTSRGFIEAEYRHFESLADFHDFWATCAEFVHTDDASMALGRTNNSFQIVDDNPYSVEPVDVPRYVDETIALTGTVIRDEVEYRVAVMVVRSDAVTCRYTAFTLSADPLEHAKLIVERVLGPASTANAGGDETSFETR